MSNPAEPVYIPAKIRASLHTAMARANDAGLAADITVASASDIGDKAVARRLMLASSSIRKGQSYTTALGNHGLLTDFERIMLSAGEQAGSIGRMHKLLGRRYEAQHLRRSRLRARMTLPIATAVLALFISPLPELVGSSITVFQYLLRSFGVVVLFLVLWHIAWLAYRRYEIHGWPRFLTQSLAAVPLFHGLLLTSTRAMTLENLATLMEAGVPAQQALAACETSAGNAFTLQLSTRAAAGLAGGASVAQSLADAGLLDRQEGFAIISTGEAAGKLTESLQHHALVCQAQLDRIWKLVSEWTPRVVYAAIAVMIIKDIFVQYSSSLAGILTL